MTKGANGFSLIELLIVVTIIGIIAAIAVPNLIQSKAAANEASALSTVRSLLNAQLTYFTNVSSYAPELASLSARALVDGVVGSGTKDGYTFAVSTGSANVTFTVDARPMAFQSTGTRSFYADQSGVIRYTTANAAATSSDPAVGQ